VNHHNSDEARAKRCERKALRKAQGIDLLAERERVIKLWKDWSLTNRGYLPHNGAWWHVFTWNLSFRRLLLPKLRARMDARDRAWKQQHAAEMRASAEAWAIKKAQRAEAKKAAKQAAKVNPQTMDLFA
jgi:hypothetical protein